MGTNYYFKIKADLKILNVSNDLEQYILNSIKDTFEDCKELHICKYSIGWKPLFQKTDFYSNMKELETFYYKNRHYLKVVDEYDTVMVFEDLLEAIKYKYNDKNKNHIDHDPYGEYYYVDNDGFEFSKREFS